MMLPVQITFRNMTPSAYVRARVNDRARRIEHFFDRVMSCRVVVEAPNRRRRKGKLYAVSVDIKAPGGELAVTRNPSAHHAHEDVYVPIRDAFDAVERRLEDFARRRRGDVKAHEPSPLGRIETIDAARGCGFLRSAAGERIYFHKNAVKGGLGRLAVGDAVRFSAEQGDKGPQATMVRRHGRAKRAPASPPMGAARSRG